MKTKILILVFLMILLVGSSFASNKTHVYITECSKLVAGIHSLNVIFYVKVTPQAAEGVLRSEIECFIKHFPPKADILATAWYSSTGSEADEKQIVLTDGKSTHLLYSTKTKKINLYDPYKR